MNQIFIILQIVMSVLIVVFVLLQKKSSGFSVSTAVVKHTRRGMEQVLFVGTIILGILFVAISLYSSVLLK